MTTHEHRRRTLSGQTKPAAAPVPPTWHELVQPQPLQRAAVRDGIWYADVRDRLPSPESLKVVEDGTEFTGKNRAARRRILRQRGSSLLGMYTRDLHRSLGQAWADHYEAKRLMRERARLEILAAAGQ